MVLPINTTSLPGAQCGLTLPSSGLAPAGSFRPSFHSRPYAACLRSPLMSNVRQHEGVALLARVVGSYIGRHEP